MEQQKYDCIVIGAGLSGLLASNLLVHKGKRILILEKNSFTGGFFSQFYNGPYEMDYAVSYFLGVEEDGLINKFFADLDLKDRLNFIKVPIADHYIFPDFEFSLKSDFEAAKEDLITLFPLEVDGIETFFDIMKKIYYSLTKLNQFKSLFNDVLVKKYLDKTYSFFINDLFTDNKLKAILSARVFGSEVSMITMVSYLGKVIIDGLYQEINNNSITKELTRKLNKEGIDVFYNHCVQSINIEDKSVKSVFVNNVTYKTDAVISSCDMTKMFCSIIYPEIPSTFKEKLIDRPKSLSSITVYIVLSKIPQKIINIKASRIYLIKNYDIIAEYKNKENNVLDVESIIKINIQNIMDNDFKDKGEYKVRVELDTSYRTPINETSKENIKNMLINLIEEKLEINTKDILKSSIYFPEDFENLTLSSMGAASGWAPDSSFIDFSDFQNKIASNLFQVGCWDKYGSGIFPIFLSVKNTITKFNR